jgi:hypothetical protein
VTCSGKTITLTGAGAGVTILDAGAVRRFFTLNNGCKLVLRSLSLRTGNRGGSGGNTGVGALRIAGGGTRGRLEVYHNSAWGTICDDAFRVKSAEVACKQMGMIGGTFYVAGGSGANIRMDDVACRGTESKLMQCPFNGWGSNDCGGNENVGVECAYGKGGGAISAESGSTLDARDVEFKDNSANYVRHSRAAAPPPASARATATAAHTRAPTPRPRRTRARNPGRRRIRFRRHRFLHELRLHFEFRHWLCAFACRCPLPRCRRRRWQQLRAPSLTPPPTHTHTHTPILAPPSPPHCPRPRATQGGVLLVLSSGTVTFASTLPSNSFSGNTGGANNYGNCYKDSGNIIGSCS